MERPIFSECFLCERMLKSICCYNCKKNVCLDCCKKEKYWCPSCDKFFPVHRLIKYYNAIDIFDDTRQQVYDSVVIKYKTNENMIARFANAYYDALLFNQRLDDKKIKLQKLLEAKDRRNKSIVQCMLENIPQPIRIRTLSPIYNCFPQINDHNKDLNVYSYVPTVHPNCVFYCSTPSCHSIIQGDECECCRIIYCGSCMKPKHKGSCKEEDRLSISFIKNNCKSCPSCHILIQKEGSCNYVVCSQCNYAFNWITMMPHFENKYQGNDNTIHQMMDRLTKLCNIIPYTQVDMSIEICVYHLIKRSIDDQTYMDTMELLIQEKHYFYSITTCIIDFRKHILELIETKKLNIISDKVFFKDVRNVINSYKDSIIIISKYYEKPFDTLCRNMDII